MQISGHVRDNKGAVQHAVRDPFVDFVSEILFDRLIAQLFCSVLSLNKNDAEEDYYHPGTPTSGTIREKKGERAAKEIAI
jgi:hypothetical protein